MEASTRMDSVYCMLSSISVVMCLWSLGVVSVSDASSDAVVVVDCPFGQIQGVKKTDEGTGQPYVSFKGIPYAKAPVGPLRFAKPQPHPNIDVLFDATKDGKVICPHPDLLTFDETEGFSEDCLILNIYTKDVNPDGGSLKKVVVFIHGGGFAIGSSSFYDPKSFVISQDVIMVTINYRIGVLGFLSTENEASPGNYGLWDQTLALTWVKDNIRAFGGDPDDVTLSGESAGGASVAYHMITPHSKGLFTKAYPQSGTATSSFARTTDGQKHALEIAKMAGCWDKEIDYKLTVEESHGLMKCLRECPVSALTTFNEFTLARIVFVPIVDGDFITDTAANLLKDEAYLESIGFFDRTYLIAIDNYEAGIMNTLLEITQYVIYSNENATKEEKDHVWSLMKTASHQLHLKTRIGEKAMSDEKVSAAIDEFYGRRIPNNYTALVEMVADVNFLIPALEFAIAASRHEKSEVYFLHFDHFPKFLMNGHHRGTSHGLDLLYWFDTTLDEVEMILRLGVGGDIPEEDLKLKGMFSSLLGEFIRSGKPGRALETMTGSGWPKYDVTNAYYLNFNLRPWVSNFLAKDKQDFWFQTVPRLMEEEAPAHKHTEL